MALGEHHEKRLFGRRKSHPLSVRQQQLLDDHLPQLRIAPERIPHDPRRDLFDGAVREVWLEIGFGGGEHLIARARANPGVGLIGCEPFLNGIAKAVGEIAEHDLANVRLLDDDARRLIAGLGDATIARAFILFPDPWPKKRHRKRRLITTAFLDTLARIMSHGGELRIATDIGDYARQILACERASSHFDWQPASARDWRERSSDWPPTRYECKALAAGRRPVYFRFIRS